MLLGDHERPELPPGHPHRPSDIGAGDFDIEFDYGNIAWDSGQASGGDANCLGGTAARAGYASGSGETGSYFEISGSGANDAFLDSTTATGLIDNSFDGGGQLGRYVYRFRNGRPLTTSGAPLKATGIGNNKNKSVRNNPTCSRAKPVNCASGDFWHSFTDVAIPGRGPALDLERTYNSLSASSEGIFGHGWASTYDMHLTTNGDGTTTITAEDGSEVTGAPVGGGSYGFPSWVDSTLTQNGDGTWTFVRHQTQTFVFSSRGQLLSIADPNGYKTTLSYGSGRLSTVTDPAGRALAFAYGANGLVSSVTDPGSRVTSYGYDGSDDLTSVTDPASGVTSFTYDGNHQLVTMTDPRGGVLTNVYDGLGRVTSQTDAMNRTTTFSYAGSNYSATGGSTTITDARGEAEVQQYVNGELISLTSASGTSDAGTWTYTYDQDTLGRTSVTDPNGHTSTFTYDANGNVTGSTDPLGRATTSTYNSLDEPLTVTDPSGVTTTSTYDPNGNLTSVSQPPAPGHTQSTTFAYGDAGHPGDVTSVTDPNGHVSQLTYDSYGDLASVTDPLGDKTTFAYDVLGERTSSVSPRGNVTGGNPSQYTTTYAYDALGRLTTVTDPLDHSVSTGYDADSNVTSRTDEKGNVTTFAYDADNELETTTRADGTTLGYTYDADGNQTTQTDGAGRTTSYAYNARNELASVTDPLSRITSYSYDPAGNTVALTDPSARVTSYGYDEANELTSTSYSDGTTPDVTYTYTPNGQRATMRSDPTGTMVYSYDGLNRLVSEHYGFGQDVSFDYDLAGNLTSITYPSGHTVTRTYDNANRLKTVKDWNNKTTSFTLDPDGNVTKITYPNTVTATTAFDATDQPTSITDKKGSTSVASFTYARDANGQLTSQTPTGTGQGSAESYSYSQLNQISQLNGSAFAYDAADNVTTLANGATMGYDSANEVTGYTPQGGSQATLSYDPQGNRVSGLTPAGTSATYTYDQANRLSSSAGGTAASYSYDGDGLRVTKTTGSTTLTYVWDISQPVPLLLTDGQTNYLYDDEGLPIEQIKGQTTLYYQRDQLSSTRLLTTASGSTAGTYAYDPYGNLLSHTGASDTPLRFAGGYQDPETGLYYLRARYYDPRTGQFLSRDPIAPLTQSAYGYVGGNPLNLIDPTGLCGPVCLVKAIGSGLDWTWEEITAAWDLITQNAREISAASATLAVIAAAAGCEPCAGVLGGIAVITAGITAFGDFQRRDYLNGSLDAVAALLGAASPLALILDRTATAAWDANELAIAARSANTRDSLRLANFELDILAADIADVTLALKLLPCPESVG